MHISRSKLDLYLECPRCFYLDKVHAIARPTGFPLTLNNAVDMLLKKEFDAYRHQGQPHPYFIEYGLDYLPYNTPELDNWRSSRRGIRTTYRGVEFFGAIDDVWQDSQGRLMIVDYKATAKAEPVMQLEEGGFHDIYRRQLEFYSWLLAQNNYPVSDQAWLVYCTGDNTRGELNRSLRFHVELIEYTCQTAWVLPLLNEVVDVLQGGFIPPASTSCGYCSYVSKRSIY